MENKEIEVIIRLEDRDVVTTLDPSIKKSFPRWFNNHNPKKIFFVSTEKKAPFPINWCTIWNEEGDAFSCPIPLVLVNLILLSECLPTINFRGCLGYFIDDLEAYNDICIEQAQATLTLDEINIAPDGEMYYWSDENNGYQPSGIFFGRETF